MTFTEMDYDTDYYLRPPTDEPLFDIDGPIRPRQAQKAALFSDMIRGKRILDVGCGRGEQSRWWAENGAREVVGIDWSQTAVNIASCYCSHLKNVTILKADARTYQHPRKHFYEVVLMIDFIEHLVRDDAIEVYKRCWEKWVTPDGWLGVVSPPRNTCVYHLYHQSRDSLRRDIEGAGFRIKYFKMHKISEPVFVVKAYRLRNFKWGYK